MLFEIGAHLLNQLHHCLLYTSYATLTMNLVSRKMVIKELKDRFLVRRKYRSGQFGGVRGLKRSSVPFDNRDSNSFSGKGLLTVSLFLISFMDSITGRTKGFSNKCNQKYGIFATVNIFYEVRRTKIKCSFF